MRTTVPDRSAALMVRPVPYTVFPASVRLIATPLPTPRLAPVTSDLHGNECSSAPGSAGSFVPPNPPAPPAGGGDAGGGRVRRVHGGRTPWPPQEWGRGTQSACAT